MLAKWLSAGGLGCLLLVLAGCRTVAPDVKPPESEEVLALPPMEDRYSRGGMAYPKQAFQDRESDLMRRFEESSVKPARGSMIPGAAGLR